jgi:dUTP pyrophosphatase
VITPPEGTCAQIISQRELILKYQVDVHAGVIDRDYQGNVMVLLQNSSTEPLDIQSSDIIAQLILYEMSSPRVEQVTSLNTTTRGSPAHQMR